MDSAGYYRLNVVLPPFTKVLGQFFFRLFDSLGKNYGKEVVSDFAILARKWSKIAVRKKVNFGLFFNSHLTGLTGRIEAAHQGDLLWLLALVTCGWGGEFLNSTPKKIQPNQMGGRGVKIV